LTPAFFTAIKQRFPQINHVQIQLMRGKHHNELTEFRYNVILHVSTETVNNTKNYSVLNWSEDNLTVSTVHQLLIENQPEILSIINVPNARVMSAVKTLKWLSDVEGFKNVGQIRKALQELENFGVEPEDFYGLNVPYGVDITWSHSSIEGHYDVVFVRQDAVGKRIIFPHSTTHSRPWQSYANNPLQAKAARKLVPQLQTYVAQKLPEYMMPSAFVVLESLPLTANDKVNRRALRALHYGIKPQLPENYIAPRTPVEQVLVKIFIEVLGLKSVGIYDNFFELGGVIHYWQLSLSLECAMPYTWSCLCVAYLRHRQLQNYLRWWKALKKVMLKVKSQC
jgi:hypothetical protein